jgi:hypothetical protein
MILRETGATEQRDGKARRQALPALALGGLLFAAGCSPSALQIPDTIPVRSYLKEQPMGMAEMANEPGSTQVGGRVADCKGKAACMVPMHPGDIFLNTKIMPEVGGNLEISVEGAGDGGVMLKRRVSLNQSVIAEETKLFKCGESARLFETDISIRIEIGANGGFVALVH